MPLYEYACLDCGNRFEELRSPNVADNNSVCEECESSRVKRLLSVFAAPRGTSSVGGEIPMFGGGGGCACGGACSCQN